MPSRMTAVEPGHRAAPCEPGRTGIVLLMVAFSITSYFDRIIMSVAGPLIMREMRLSETLLGALMKMGLGCAESMGAAAGILNAGGNAGGFLLPMATPFTAARLVWSWSLDAGGQVVVIGAVLWFFIDVTKASASSRPMRLKGAASSDSSSSEALATCGKEHTDQHGRYLVSHDWPSLRPLRNNVLCALATRTG